MEMIPDGMPSRITKTVDAFFKELEARIDKSPAVDIVIHDATQYVEVANRIKHEKRERQKLVDSVDPLGKLAFRFHRSITGGLNNLVAFYDARIEKQDRALVEYTAEQDRIEREEKDRLAEIARQDEEARKKAEVEALNARAKKEKRPDLAVRAKEIEATPVRDVSVSVNSGALARPKVKGVGVKTSYDVEIVDEDALKVAVARPHVLREVLAVLDKLQREAAKKKITPKYTKKDRDVHVEVIGQLAGAIRSDMQSAAQIPFNVLEVVESKVKANAVATNGGINWPGVSVFDTRKTTTRTR